jgi:transcriptional regulator with XRE-family HTH domain
MEIHDKIRTIRISKGFTQEYIADKLNIDAVNYGRIERGQTKITIDRLIKIAEIFDVKVIDFFSETNFIAKQNGLLEKIYETENQILQELLNIKNKIY